MTSTLFLCPFVLKCVLNRFLVSATSGKMSWACPLPNYATAKAPNAGIIPMTALSTVEIYFAEEIWRKYGKEEAQQWILLQRKEQMMSDSASACSGDSYSRSCGGMSVASDSSGTSTASTISTTRRKPVVNTKKEAGKEGWRQESSTDDEETKRWARQQKEQMIAKFIAEMSSDCSIGTTGAQTEVPGNRTSPGRANPRRCSEPVICLEVGPPVQRGESSLKRSVSSLNVALAATQEQADIDRSGLLYTDAAYLVAD
jgi:hypothetical protein